MTTALPAPPTFRGRFCTEFAERSVYSEGAGPYRIVPTAVAIPADLDDLVGLVRFAGEEGVPLVPRGAGSGMPGGNVGSAIIVDLQCFAGRPAITPEGLARVGAGVTWSDLDRGARARGLYLPPNPSSGAYCTLGGMAATNAAGPRSVWAGSIRRWISGLRMVTADGEVAWIGRRASASPSAPEALRLDQNLRAALGNAAELVGRSYPATTKNSAGYALDSYIDSGDLLDVIIGSEGTLGIITDLSLQLVERPSDVAGLLVAVTELSELGEIVQALRRHDPTAIELLDRSFLDIARADTHLAFAREDALLLVDFERASRPAADGAVADAVESMRRAGISTRPALGREEHERLWRLRHAASPVLAALPEPKRSLQIIEDGCVPVPALGRYVEHVRLAARDHGIEIVAFGHAGDGHLHVNAIIDTSARDIEQRLMSLLDAVTTSVTELGGTPSGEHGDGRLRAGLLTAVFGREITDLFRRIKASFDPVGILNPGVIVAEATTPTLAHLKVGSDAASIPEHIAHGLRDIERRGAWGTPKLDLV